MAGKDTLDVALSEDDIKEMEPAFIYAAFQKLREHRKDLMQQRDLLQDNLRKELNRAESAESLVRAYNKQLTRARAALAEITMREVLGDDT